MNDIIIEERLISSLKPHPLNETIYQDSSSPSDDLINSIKEFGFNDRITISKDDVIISGHRRWLALKALKYETVPVFVLEETDPDKLTEYLITMNQTSRVRSKEQIAREYEVLKAIEDKKAKARREAGNNQYSPMENCPQPSEKGSSRDIAASKLNANMSGKTAEKALKVVKIADEIAKDDPAKAQDIKDTLNNVSVNAAYEKTKEDNPTKKSSFDKKIYQENNRKGMIISKLKKIEVDSIPDIIQEAFSLVSLKFQQSKYINADETAALMQTRILSDIIKGLSTDDVKILDGLLTIQNQISKKIKKMQGQCGGLN